MGGEEAENLSPRFLCCPSVMPSFLSVTLKFVIFFFIEKNEAENLEENEEPFIAPLGLNVPPDVELVCGTFRGVVRLRCCWEIGQCGVCGLLGRRLDPTLLLGWN